MLDAVITSKNSIRLFHKNSDVISFNWVNDFKVEIHVYVTYPIQS